MPNTTKKAPKTTSGKRPQPRAGRRAFTHFFTCGGKMHRVAGPLVEHAIPELKTKRGPACEHCGAEDHSHADGDSHLCVGMDHAKRPFIGCMSCDHRYPLAGA